MANNLPQPNDFTKQTAFGKCVDTEALGTAYLSWWISHNCVDATEADGIAAGITDLSAGRVRPLADIERELAVPAFTPPAETRERVIEECCGAICACCNPLAFGIRDRTWPKAEYNKRVGKWIHGKPEDDWVCAASAIRALARPQGETGEGNG